MRQWSILPDGSLVMDGEVVGHPPTPDSASEQEKIEIGFLIAAAPEMYDVLRDLIYFLENYDKQDRSFDSVRLARLKMAKMAITKARGRTK